MLKKLYFGFLLLLLFLAPTSVVVNFLLPEEASIFKLDSGEENQPIIASNFIQQFPVNFTTPVYEFTIDAQIKLNNNAFLRIILTDDQDREYLVSETYSALTENSIINLKDSCEETCILDGITPKSLKIEGNSADFNLNKINSASKPQVRVLSKNDLKVEKTKAKIQALNLKIKQTGKNWTAGETSISKLSYAEKRKLFGIPEDQPLPNWQGFEYYKGGVFEVLPASQTPAKPNIVFSDSIPLAPAPSSSPSPYQTSIPMPTPYPTLAPIPSPFPSPQPPSIYRPSWDWRNTHGQNWMTPVKNQLSCGSCWAFAAIGATEAQANLFYNQHLNLDLSEQQSVCLIPVNRCGGGFSSSTFDALKVQGLVTEACYSYTGTEVCLGPCTDQINQLWKITENGTLSSWPIADIESIKQQLITQGPFTFGIKSWWHVMTLAGYETDSLSQQPVWIVKNSWGSDWGENGYAKLIIPVNDIYHLYYGYQPFPYNSPPPTIECTDQDQDQYCNWGISETKPATCPAFCRQGKDCDDANPNLGTYNLDFSCQPLTPSPSPNYCINECGDGFCAEVVCLSTDCPCLESTSSCPQDCPQPSFLPSPSPSPISTQITIYAAGTAYKNISPSLYLYINNKLVKSWSNIKGNPYLRIFQKFVFDYPKAIKKTDKIQIIRKDPVTIPAAKRYLRVDKIIINKTTYQTEADSTYSTGTASQYPTCTHRYAKSEWLHCNVGYFLYKL